MMTINRRMKKHSLFLVVFSLLLFTTSQADEVVPFQYNDDNLLLPIPDGFCNATEELVGIFAIDYLNKQISGGLKDNPEPVIVFTRCGFENNLEEMYPWGYIGLMKNFEPSITQKTYNKMLDTYLDSSEMMQELYELAEGATISTISEYGFDVNRIDYDEITLVWTDENVAVISTTIGFFLEGEQFIENIIGEGTTLNKTIVNYYITEIENGVTIPIQNASLLIDNSKRLVRMNK